MNNIENLDQQLDILHDLILENLGNITDCKTRQILIDMFKYQSKTTTLLVETIKVLMENINDSVHTVPLSEPKADQNID